jgi:hypothetical protein
VHQLVEDMEILKHDFVPPNIGMEEAIWSKNEGITDKSQVSSMYFFHRIVKNAKYVNLLSCLWNIKCDFYLMLINV